MTTTTIEIERARWPEFFNLFSIEHERWLVTIEVFGADFGAQTEGTALRFEGICADLKNHENSIAVTLGERVDSHITHVIQAPTHVRLEQSEVERGTFETLQIESGDGTTTLVRFLAGVVPDVRNSTEIDG